MEDPLTTITLILLNLGTLVIWVRKLPDLKDPARTSQARSNLLLIVISLVTMLLFLFRWGVLRQTWLPMESHLDGLLLLISLFSISCWYLSKQGAIERISLYGLPCLAILMLWAICSSTFTLRQFRLAPGGVQSLWNMVHLVLVYGGFMFSLISACGGMAYLVLQWRIKKRKLIPSSGLGNLESIENVIVKTVTISFVLITLALITGVVIQVSAGLSVSDFLDPKIMLAFTSWLIYALLTNIRRSSLLRGHRAAWLSIFALILMLVTFAIVHKQSARETKENKQEQVRHDFPNRDRQLNQLMRDGSHL